MRGKTVALCKNSLNLYTDRQHHTSQGSHLRCHRCEHITY